MSKDFQYELVRPDTHPQQAASTLVQNYFRKQVVSRL